jgi:WD40 repeat protein
MKQFVLLMTVVLNVLSIKGMEEEPKKVSPLRALREKMYNNKASEECLCALSYSPDGERMAVASNNTIKIFNVSNNEVLQEFFPSKLPLSVNFCEDGVRLIFTDGYNNMNTDMQIWNSQTGERMQMFKGYFDNSDANSCSYDGTLCLHAEPEVLPAVWDIETKTALETFKNEAVLFAVALSYDARQCAMGGKDEIIRTFDVRSGELISKFEDNETGIFALAYTPNAEMLISGPGPLLESENGTIKVRDLKSGKAIQEVQQNSTTMGIACSPDNKTVAYTQTSDNEVHCFEINTHKEALTIEAHKSKCSLW